MRELGYIDGQNLKIEYRWADDNFARLPRLAYELASLNVDLIVAWTTPASLAAKRATAKIPIVIIGVADPVGAGLVASLGRPGANITGVTNISAELSGKLVDVFVQVVPGIKRLGSVYNPLNPVSVRQLRETQTAADKLGVSLESVEVRGPEDIEAAVGSLAKKRVGGVVFIADPLFFSQRQRIADLALKHRLPTAFAREENTEAGGLIAYGPSLSNDFRRITVVVDKILKGAIPAEMPIEQPMSLHLVVNLKTAKALGLTVPQPVLLRADRLIE